MSGRRSARRTPLNRSRRFSMSIAGVAAVALIGCSEPQADNACTHAHAALIPAYVPPAELTRLATDSDPTRLVVVNPDSGPGAALDPAYADVIDQLRSTGNRVLGYVSTGHGTRDPALVRTEVARYASWYKIIDIFVDEVAHDEAALPYYTALSTALRTTAGRLIVLNPGMVPAPGYFALADIVVTFEGTFADYHATPDPLRSVGRGLSRTRTAHLIYGASDAQAVDVVIRHRADYVYATSGTLPNPWNTLASSLTEQQARLAQC